VIDDLISTGDTLRYIIRTIKAEMERKVICRAAIMYGISDGETFLEDIINRDSEMIKLNYNHPIKIRSAVK